jgi:hypothetical protein
MEIAIMVGTVTCVLWVGHRILHKVIHTPWLAGGVIVLQSVTLMYLAFGDGRWTERARGPRGVEPAERRSLVKLAS